MQQSLRGQTVGTSVWFRRPFGRACRASWVVTLALGGLCAYAAPEPPDLAASVSGPRISADLRALTDLGSRVVGYPGNARAADMIEAQFRDLGLEVLTQRFDLPTPLDRGASLRVGDATYPLAAVWPNLVRTSQAPPEGIDGDIIYVGQGRLSDYNGHITRHSIVLIDFNTQQSWLNAPLLDAAAVVFVEPSGTTRGEAEMKFLRCPVNVPRFYVKGRDADAIIAAAAQGRTTGHLTASMPWVNAPSRNILGILPGRDPELSKQAIIIEAYYDSISVAPQLSPGAENAVGIATMLEMARALKAHPPARTVIFLATDGHFQCFAGAREFTRLWGREPRRAAQRYDRLREHERDLAELQSLKAQCETDLAKLREQIATHTLPEKGAGQGPAVLIGQLPIPPRAAVDRIARLGAEMANTENDIAIWKRLDQFTSVRMFCGLDLSSHNPAVGVFQIGSYYSQSQYLRFYSPVGKQFADWAEDIAPRLGQSAADVFVDGINPTKGREWYTYFPGKIGFDHELAIRGGRPGIVLATVNDARQVCDTPLDTFDRLDMGNIVNQAKLLTGLLYRFVDDPNLDSGALKRVQSLKKIDDLEEVTGTVLEFRRRESFVPNTVVPGALVLVQGPSRMLMGVHTEVMQIANETSEFRICGTAAEGGRLEAYAFDPKSGDISYAPDMGADGDMKYPRDVLGRSGLRRPVVVFRCVPTDIFDLVDERYFQTLGRMFVYNAKDYSEPISYGYSLASGAGAGSELPSYVEPCSVIYSMPDVDLQVTMGMGLLGVRMALINSTPRNPLGEGFRAAFTPRIPFTPLQVAHDMWVLDETRMTKLRRYGITNSRLDELHSLSKEALDISGKAIGERRYDTALAAARHAWGYESRAYPDVKDTERDVIKGVLFYLAFLLPFAFFGERLLIASRTIIGQIIGTVAVFAVVFAALAAVHPAFALTQAPPIILLAFIIMALAVLVIAIVTRKFNEELKAMKQSRGGVHEADVGRLSATAAAFSLGIANMRRRVARTALTAVTLILLTFTVLSFTSVVARLKTNQIVLNKAPAYPGVMLRDRSWMPLEGPTADIIANELSQYGSVAPRAWYASLDIEKEQIIDLALASDPSKRYTVSCILGLSPQEDKVTAVSRAIVAGRFLLPGEKSAVVLPATVAQALGMGLQDVGSASIELFGTTFRVVGIADEKRLRAIVDLDGENMTPVNYAMLRPEVIKELKEQAAQRSQLGQTGAQSLLQEYKHYGPEKLIILPYDRTLELGGTLRSVAVRYNDPSTVGAGVERMMKRFALSVYAGIGDQTYLFSSADLPGFSGAGSVIVPIIIAALIVLNTMLGAVYERTREIGIYSSLGLAPVHVSMLFLAEASVFANLGAIVGYLIGQIVAKILFSLHATGGLELNYSSTSAVAVTCVVVAVVLLSTLYPSKKASQLASPGIERRWSLPEPVGDDMTIRLPFTVTGRDAWGVSAFLKEFFDDYVGYAGGEFLAEDVRLEATGETGAGVYVRLRMWLAPYDLGVSQDFELACEPTEDGDIYQILIRLHRLAGDVTSWRKTNTLFLASIRKQFLIWRTVPQTEKVSYGDRAHLILRGEYVEPDRGMV